MSYIILSTPVNTLLSAGNDNYYTVSGTTIGAPNVFDYKYIADIYINGILQVTLKSFPDPDFNIGVFNTRNIITSFLGVDFFPTWDTANIFQQCPNSSCDVDIVFGEEYVSGTTFIQNRNITDTGNRYINASIPFPEYVNIAMDATYLPQGQTNISYLEYPIFGLGPTGLETGFVYDMYSGQNKFLYFVNNPNDSDDDRGFSVIITTYDVNGNELGQYQFNNPFSAVESTGVQAVNCSYDFLNGVSSGAYTVLVGSAPIITPDVASYKENVIGQSDISGWNAAFFYIKDNCGRTAPDSINVYWFNHLGGFDSWLFNKKNETTETKSVQKYKKIPGKLQSDGTFLTTTYDRSQQPFYTSLQDSTVMFSDLLTDIDVLYLKYLVSSPVVFVQPNNDPGFMTAVTVEDNSYKINKRVNQKIYSLQMTINQSYNDYRQIL